MLDGEFLMTNVVNLTISETKALEFATNAFNNELLTTVTLLFCQGQPLSIFPLASMHHFGLVQPFQCLKL